MTKWLVAQTVNVEGGKKEYSIAEHPLLHACCNQDHFGDVNIDFRPEVNPDFVCDVTKPLPFTKEQFKAGFMGVPWINAWKWNLGKAIKEMLKVCEIVYVVSPWLYGWRGCRPESIEVSWRPGINSPILFVKYVKTEKFWIEIDKTDELNEDWFCTYHCRHYNKKEGDLHSKSGCEVIFKPKDQNTIQGKGL